MVHLLFLKMNLHDGDVNFILDFALSDVPVYHNTGYSVYPRACEKSLLGWDSNPQPPSFASFRRTCILLDIILYMYLTIYPSPLVILFFFRILIEIPHMDSR